MNTYEKQANDFLKKSGATITADFLKFGSHFEGEETQRNIFKITISKGEKSFSFDFGDSIHNSCNEVTIPITETVEKIEVFAGLRGFKGTVDGSVKFELLKENNFEISIEEISTLADKLAKDYTKNLVEYCERKKISKYDRPNTISGGEAVNCITRAIKRELEKTTTKSIRKEEINKPTNYDILACMTKYDPETFEDFCSNFGYDTDSKKAERIYNSVKDEYKNLCDLFNEIEMNELQEIN